MEELWSSNHLFPVLWKTSKPINTIPKERGEIGKGWFRQTDLQHFSLVWHPSHSTQQPTDNTEAVDHSRRQSCFIVKLKLFPGQRMNHTGSASHAKHKRTERATKRAISPWASQRDTLKSLQQNTLEVCETRHLYGIWNLNKKPTESYKQVPWCPEGKSLSESTEQQILKGQCTLAALLDTLQMV